MGKPGLPRTLLGPGKVSGSWLPSGGLGFSAEGDRTRVHEVHLHRDEHSGSPGSRHTPGACTERVEGVGDVEAVERVPKGQTSEIDILLARPIPGLFVNFTDVTPTPLFSHWNSLAISETDWRTIRTPSPHQGN